MSEIKMSLADLMAEIVGRQAPKLRERGFQRRRYVFNRRTAGKLVHVVSFYQCPYTSSAYGGFVVNADLHCPATELYHDGKVKPDNWVNPAVCTYRYSLHPDDPYMDPNVWPLSPSQVEQELESKIVAAIDGLSYYQSSDDILRMDKLDQFVEGWRGASTLPIPLVRTCIFLDRRDLAAAKNEISSYLKRRMRRSHKERVKCWAEINGLI